MNPLRMAVIGAGHLGCIHARLLNQLEDIALVGVVDPYASARTRVAQEASTQAFASYSDLPNDIDAVIVATPTRTHRDVALSFLQRGVHVLVEKPIALTSADADEMVDTAARAGAVLQVGHVERFNPAVRATVPYLTGPRFIESTRESGYTFRSTDIGVVHDLMIHDIDLALWLTQSDVVQVEATGLTVVGPHEDMAHAQLTMRNGCQVSLKASRISQNGQRHCRIYAERAYAEIDYATGQASVVRPGELLLHRETAIQGVPVAEKTRLKDAFFSTVLPTVTLDVAPCNAILEEQREFVHCVRRGATPTVSGVEAGRAIAVAEQVLQKVHAHAWDARDAVVAEQFDAAFNGRPIPLPLLPQIDQRRAG